MIAVLPGLADWPGWPNLPEPAGPGSPGSRGSPGSLAWLVFKTANENEKNLLNYDYMLGLLF